MKFTELIDKTSWKLILFTGLFIIFSFNLIFYLLSLYSHGSGLITPEGTTYLSTLYFSVLTFTSSGYGDISPVGISILVSIIEAITGLLFFGIFIAKIVSERNNRMLNKIYEFEYLNFLNTHKKRLSENRRILSQVVERIVDKPEDAHTKKEIKYNFGTDTTGVIRHIGVTIRSLNNFLEREKQRKEYFINEVDVYYMQGLIHSLYITIKSVNKAFRKLDGSKIKWKNWATKSLIKFLHASTDQLITWLLENYSDDEIEDKAKKIKNELSEFKPR